MELWEKEIVDKMAHTKKWRRMLSKHHGLKGATLTSLIRRDPIFAYHAANSIKLNSPKFQKS